MDLRMQCLNRRLGETRALTEVFAARADPEVLDKAVQAAMGLIPLGQCADEKALLAEVPPPEEPGTRKQVEDIRKKLDEAEALEKTGKFQEGLRLAQESLAAGEQTAYPPVAAEALFRVGSTLEKVGPYQEAEKNLRLAVKAADASGHDRLRAEALNEVIFVVGYRRAHFKAAEHAIEAAEQVITRIKDEGDIKARWLNNTGAMYREKGEYDRALTHHERALKIWERTLGPKHTRLVFALDGLGWIALHRDETAKARALFERVLSICGTGSAALGAPHSAPHSAPHGADKCKGEEREPRSDAQFGLARILWKHREERAKALDLARQALRFFKTQKSAAGMKRARDAEAWIEARADR